MRIFAAFGGLREVINFDGMKIFLESILIRYRFLWK